MTTTPMLMKEQCLGMRVRLLARAVTEIHDRAMARHDLTTSQANLLAAVTNAGPITSGALASVLHMDKSTVSRVLEGLKRRGLIARAPHDDRRVRQYESSADGIRLLERLRPDWETAQQETRALLGPRGDEMLHALADPLLQEGIQRALQKETKR